MSTRKVHIARVWSALVATVFLTLMGIVIAPLFAMWAMMYHDKFALHLVYAIVATSVIGCIASIPLIKLELYLAKRSKS